MFKRLAFRFYLEYFSISTLSKNFLQLEILRTKFHTEIDDIFAQLNRFGCFFF